MKTFKKGQKILFKRTNNEWQDGRVANIAGDYVVVEWESRNGFKIGKKIIHQSVIKTDELRSAFNIRCKLFFNVYFSIFIIICLCIYVDKYFQIKKVL